MAWTVAQIDTIITNNQTLITNYQTALINNDSTNPAVTAVIDAISLQTNQWRIDLLEIITKLIEENEMLSKIRNKLTPYEFHTRYIIQ